MSPLFFVTNHGVVLEVNPTIFLRVNLVLCIYGGVRIAAARSYQEVAINVVD